MNSRDPIEGSARVYRGRPVNRELASTIPNLLKRYPLINLYSVYQILKQRTSCLQFDPHYALRMVWEITQKRHRYYLEYLKNNEGRVNQTRSGLQLLIDNLNNVDDILQIGAHLHYKVNVYQQDSVNQKIWLVKRQMSILQNEVNRRLQQ